MLRPERAPTTTDLAQRLKDLRTAAGLSQNTLAAALTISVALISSWESRKAIPPVNRLEQYARYFADLNGDGTAGRQALSG